MRYFGQSQIRSIFSQCCGQIRSIFYAQESGKILHCAVKIDRFFHAQKSGEIILSIVDSFTSFLRTFCQLKFDYFCLKFHYFFNGQPRDKIIHCAWEKKGRSAISRNFYLRNTHCDVIIGSWTLLLEIPQFLQWEAKTRVEAATRSRPPPGRGRRRVEAAARSRPPPQK